jgi:transposase InsO family protein
VSVGRAYRRGGRTSPPGFPAPGWPAILPISLAWEGSLFLATAIDCATRKVIGWAMDDNYRTPLITAAIEMAAANGIKSVPG